MKKLELFGITASILISTKAQSQIHLNMNDQNLYTVKNIKIGETLIVYQNNKMVIELTYDQLSSLFLKNGRLQNAIKIQNIHNEFKDINLGFLDDMSIDVSASSQSGAPPNAGGESEF